MAYGVAYSADAQFINDTTRLKQEFIDADFVKDHRRKLDALKNLNLLLQPKMDVRDELKQIYWIEENLHKISVLHPQTGEVIGFNPGNQLKLDRYMRGVIDSMLKKAQKIGVYTKEIVEASKSMSDFGRS